MVKQTFDIVLLLVGTGIINDDWFTGALGILSIEVELDRGSRGYMGYLDTAL